MSECECVFFYVRHPSEIYACFVQSAQILQCCAALKQVQTVVGCAAGQCTHVFGAHVPLSHALLAPVGMFAIYFK